MRSQHLSQQQLAIVEVKCFGVFSPSASKYAAFQEDIRWISPGRESCLRKKEWKSFLSQQTSEVMEM